MVILKRDVCTLFNSSFQYIGHCNLPLYKKCHVDFLHAVLDDRKFALELHQLRTFHIEAHWPEYAIKNVFPQIKTH